MIRRHGASAWEPWSTHPAKPIAMEDVKNCEPTGLERAQAEATQSGHEMQEEGDVPAASLTRCPRIHME